METKEINIFPKYISRVKELSNRPTSINALLIDIINDEEYDDIIKNILYILNRHPYVVQYINFHYIEDIHIIEEMIKYNPDVLRYVPGQPEDLCILALETCNKARGRLYKPESLFRYVIKPQYQTDKICLYAVSLCGSVLNKVVNQTEEICIAAVKQHGLALRFVREQTVKICAEAVKQNPKAFKYIDEDIIHKDIYLEAIIGKIKELDEYIEDKESFKQMREIIIKNILELKE